MTGGKPVGTLGTPAMSAMSAMSAMPASSARPASSPREDRLGWPTPPPGRRTLGLLTLAAVGLGSGFVLAQPGAPPSLVTLAGALLALAVPGMALCRALFPGPGMGRAERITLTIGLQFALLVACGFLLHLLRPGLSAASWGALLADITLVACAAAWIRGRQTATGAAGVASASGAAGAAAALGRPAGPGVLVSLSRAPNPQLGMLVAAGLVAALALAVARAGVVAQPQPAWTALGIAAADGGRSVAVDITNAEGRPETYRLVATIDGEPLAIIADLAVADDASLTRTITLPPAGAFLRAVDVGLWRSGDPPDGDAYRSVRLSLRGVPGP